MDFLFEYGLFLAKALTVLVVVVAAAGALAGIPARLATGRDRITVRHLNRRYHHMGQVLRAAIAGPRGYRERFRAWREERRETLHGGERPRLFVLHFIGDLRASALSALREEITAVLTVARPEDGVVVRLESLGGLVPNYGLAASQLARIKQRKVPLTVLTDNFAASGGYLMAAVADRIIAAPFAIVGSIGVIAQFPNFHRFLKKYDIDFEQFMAGEFKRTVTLFGENTEPAREKFRQQIEEAHSLLKDFLREYRPQLDMARVATGDYWYGKRALELQLVDELRTSDDFLQSASQTADLYEVRYTARRPHYFSRLGLAGKLP